MVIDGMRLAGLTFRFLMLFFVLSAILVGWGGSSGSSLFDTVVAPVLAAMFAGIEVMLQVRHLLWKERQRLTDLRCAHRRTN